MSLNFINLMPTELLCQVFECLDPVTRRTAAKVCTRWSAIMWHFGQPDDFERKSVRPADLVDEERSHNLLRSVLINEDDFRKAEDIQLLQRYLFCEMQVENLLRMSIRISKEIWNETFGKEKDLHLPNLKYIRVRYGSESDEQLAMRCRIVAPKLRTFHQEGKTIRDLLLVFSSQIQNLMVMNSEKSDLFSVLGLRFPNLRSLILKVNKGSNLEEAECSHELKALFSNLDHLKIIDWRGILAPAIGFIIQGARKLKSLKVYAPKMNEDVLNRINNLKQLKELTFMTYIDQRHYPLTALSLPDLVKLTMFAARPIPLESVPSLRDLIFEYDRHLYGKGDRYAIFTYWDNYMESIGHQLETLEMINMFLERSTVDDICNTLPNLLALKLINVEVEFERIETLIEYLPNLRLARFENCRLAEYVAECDFIYMNTCRCGCCDDDDNWDDERQRLSRAKRQNFYPDLSAQYEDCAIAVFGGCFLWCFKSYHFALDVASDRAERV